VTAAAIAVLWSGVAYAQAVSGTLLGSIADQGGLGMPGVTVTITETSTNISLTATIDPDEDLVLAELSLWAHAKESAHAQIDQALEANDIAAKYDPAPRYQVLQTYWNEWDHRGETKPPQYVIIAPDTTTLERGAYTQKLIGVSSRSDSRRLRYDHALRIATAQRYEDEGYTLIDCADGDLTSLNLAIGASESNPEVAPTAESPF
jgi:hypothetical protein